MKTIQTKAFKMKDGSYALVAVIDQKMSKEKLSQQKNVTIVSKRDLLELLPLANKRLKFKILRALKC